MNNYNKMKPFPEQFDIVYGHQIDYKRIQKSTNVKEILSLAAQNHPMLVLQPFEDDNTVVGVFGTSNVDNVNKKNDLIIPKGQAGLIKNTLFRFDGRSINYLNFTDEFFPYRNPLITGKISFIKQNEVRLMFLNIPQIEEIITHLKEEEQQILSKLERESLRFYI